MTKYTRKASKHGQKPTYTFTEVNNRTLNVVRDNDGDLFEYNFSIGHKFETYAGTPVEMIGLNPNGGNPDSGYYIIVREITPEGLGKLTDVSAQNQVDKIYWGLKQADDSSISGEINTQESQEYVEGAVKQVTVNKYERDPKARKACIEYYGTRCQICSFDFAKKYGPHGSGFIEVHHIKPLNTIAKSYKVDPVKDLIPVCSNCHSILHRGTNPLSVDGLRSILN
ncbi:HNH endonuclease [Vibrio sp. 10N.286.52.C3]|uniref:HNH endonuclease n=1 Tax=Vibrio sp. 10N.286.52.C3 TaxID=3229713 RepID=UPI00354B6C6E